MRKLQAIGANVIMAKQKRLSPLHLDTPAASVAWRMVELVAYLEGRDLRRMEDPDIRSWSDRAFGDCMDLVRAAASDRNTDAFHSNVVQLFPSNRS